MKVRINNNQPNAAQRKIIREECAKEFDRLVDNYNRRVALQVLHILYFDFDFDKDQLKLFSEKLAKMQKEAVDRYEISNSEVPDICEIHLRDAGVNVDDFLK